MFVRHRWPQSFRWWLFSRFPREDAAADYECGHNCPERPKLYLLHCGALRRPTPLRAIIDLPAHQVSRTNSGSFAIFAAIRRAPCSASDLRPNLPRGVPGDKIYDPHSDRARPVVCRHSSYGRRDEGEGRHRITRGSRIASSRVDRQLAEKALHAKAKFKLTPTTAAGSGVRSHHNSM